MLYIGITDIAKKMEGGEELRPSANCETIWIIFQPWALSFDTTASRKRVFFLFYNISQSEHTKIVPEHFVDFFMFLCTELPTSISFLHY